MSGVPYYGYHSREHMFLKLFFYDPLMIKRAATLLQNGGVMERYFQPHESHIPYILQFMMDYNLQGMNFLHLRNAKFQHKTEDGGDSCCAGNGKKRMPTLALQKMV